ncbi:MAG: esterase-like activity of phytase family protein, partial [Acidimicrobiia bacterium]|nr:esterase-like activity of phytase family protein [Acidimicrobiia bacterium]
ADTEVGGLSGITYDRRRNVYYALSDDRSQRAPSRFYTLKIDLGDGRLDAGDVVVVDVTPLTDRSGDSFAAKAIDPEGITLVGRRRLFISTEGDADAEPPIDPFVNRFKRSGRQKKALRLPARFLPDADGTTGVRFNEGFESLTSTPGGDSLYAATEASLAQDGPATDVGQSSLARLLHYDLRDRRVRAEYVYVVEPVAEPPDPPDAFRINGLVELLALDDEGTFLALERSFSVGRGNTVNLYEVSTAGATDVSGEETLFPGGEMLAHEPVSKRRLLSFADLGLVPDNLEGLAFGPPMADGRLPLIVVSDNNFNPDQETQFVLLAVELTD